MLFWGGFFRRGKNEIPIAIGRKDERIFQMALENLYEKNQDGYCLIATY
jgi:hypothetical protein